MKIIWSERAAFRVKETASYIKKEFGNKSKLKFLGEIDSVVSVLKFNPKMGALDPFLTDFPVEIRSVRVNDLNRIVYYIDNKSIVIVSFRDNRRDPKDFADDVDFL